MRIGYKKAALSTSFDDRRAIVKLQILGIVRGRDRRGKRRTSRAKVLSIRYLKGSPPRIGRKLRVAYAIYSISPFPYRVGKVVEPMLCKFDKSSCSCAPGIHFFWKLKDAMAYNF